MTRMILPKTEVKIEATVLKCTRALAVLRDIRPSLEPRNRITQEEMRLKKAHNRRSRKGARMNEKVCACTTSSNDPNACAVRYPPRNANGISDASH